MSFELGFGGFYDVHDIYDIERRGTDELMKLCVCFALGLLVAPTLQAAGSPEDKWISLFDGKTLGGWKRTEFAAGGDVRVEPKFPKEKGDRPAIVVEMGEALSGFNWVDDRRRTAEDESLTKEGGKKPVLPEIPKSNYEIALEFMKVDGNDFACGLTFPVGDSFASLILGGWGGRVVGISSIDGQDASENQTTQGMDFEKNRWYKVRMRVTPEKLEAWVDEKQLIDQEIKGRKISLRHGEISMSKPLGIATYRTTAAFREIRIRLLDVPGR